MSKDVMVVQCSMALCMTSCTIKPTNWSEIDHIQKQCLKLDSVEVQKIHNRPKNICVTQIDIFGILIVLCFNARKLPDGLVGNGIIL